MAWMNKDLELNMEVEKKSTFVSKINKYIFKISTTYYFLKTTIAKYILFKKILS